MSAVTGRKLEPVKCGICDYRSKRITSVEDHIVEVHGTTAKRLYDDTHGPTTCRCGCGNEPAWINWKVGYSSMIRGHNASIYDVYDETEAKKLAATRGTNWRGMAGWSKDLTKDTDERVASRAVATSEGRRAAIERGEVVPWSKGLTKKTDDRIKRMSESLTAAYAEGKLKPWALGSTKQTDPRVAAMAAKVSLACRSTALRTHLDELKRLNKEEVRSRIEETGKFNVINDLSDYENDATPNIYVMCNTCGDKSYSSLRKLKYHRCYACDPCGSVAQGEIGEYISSLGIEVQKNVRNVIAGPHRGAELDLYIPSKKLAIEYNGLYWHCDIHKPNNYHQNKSELTSRAGIRLMHVFQDEWTSKKDIIKSMIRHAMGMSENRIGARKCSMVTLTPSEKRTFFNDNHIDGDTNSTCALGLKHDNEIVMAISLRHPFHKKHKNSIEVARLCTARNTIVSGGLSRMTLAAKKWARENGHKGLISYVDTRLGSDASNWIAAGWTKTGTTPPRFWWTDMNNRYNRFKYRANSQKGLSEADVAAEAGVVRIYGCSNIIVETNAQ